MSDSTYRTSDKKHLIKMREILLTHVCAYTKHMSTHTRVCIYETYDDDA